MEQGFRGYPDSRGFWGAVIEVGDVKAIANELSEPYVTLVLVLAVTGLRAGEAVGLR